MLFFIYILFPILWDYGVVVKKISVVDPHHIDADPDPDPNPALGETYFFADADSGSTMTCAEKVVVLTHSPS